MKVFDWGLTAFNFNRVIIIVTLDQNDKFERIKLSEKNISRNAAIKRGVGGLKIHFRV